MRSGVAAIQQRSTGPRTWPSQGRCLSIKTASKHLHLASFEWRPVPVLQDARIDNFRRDAFQVQRPMLMPPRHFMHLPAITKWFKPCEQQDGAFQLDYRYLEQFGDALVPLELSTTSNSSTVDIEDFQRSEAPLSVFLSWVESASLQTHKRLYLAQASLADMPRSLRGDIPTPQIVLQAGRGHLYDTNVWLGIAPTYTPLHKDPNPNLFVQLAGRKVVRILPPDAGRETFALAQTALGRDASAVFRGDEMMKGEEKLLLQSLIWGDHSPDDKAAFPGSQATLNSGDGLFIPRGWWHSIAGVGNGVTGSVNWWFR